jgi:hypothetical protein
MTFRTCGLSLAGLALLALSPTGANAEEQHQISLHNDVGRPITCGVRRAGSSAIDSFTLRAGESWSKSYSGSKTRLVLCEGAMSSWQPLVPDRPYRLVKADAERIVAEAASGR